MKAFLVVLFVVLLSAAPALADEYSINGYRLRFSVSQSGNVLRANGRVEGPSCKLLQVQVFITNENGYLHSILVGVKNVDGGGRLLDGAAPIYNYGTRWDITSVYARCAQ